MRRLLLIATTLCLTGAGLLTAVAGADDTHGYKIELDNAFGIVEGSIVKVAGVEAGRVVSLDVNEDKRALIEVETTGAIGELGEDTTCSSEPQSLIAEYFIDCQPAGDPLPEGGTIPVEQVTQTVQPDLVNNTLREPFKRRFQIIINEFGTALAGNPENLNSAIRRGAPALRELEEMLDILADQNRIIRNLNEDSEQVITRLASRREDVVRFVQEARDTAAASASRRADLSRNFEILDDFLAELRPTLADTETLARAQTPVLADLRAAAPGLNTLAENLPEFNVASEASLTTLGDAAVVGRRALDNGSDEIATLRRSFKNAPRSAELLADLLADADDPRRAVEIDARAERDTGRSSSEPGTKDTMGYTALEGLLNYAYYQAGALNQYDNVSHLLHFSLYGGLGANTSGRCGAFSTGRDPNTGEPGVPAADGGLTTVPEEADRCLAWLGPNQPGITEPLDLPRYDPSVCPQGTKPAAAAAELCDPNIPADAESFERAGASGLAATATGPGSSLGGPGGAAPGTTPGLPSAPGQGDVEKGLEDLLGLPGEAGLPDVGRGLGGDGIGGNSNGKGKGGNGGGAGAGGQASDELMDFLFGS
jgi:virulence factor Mce-like protein